MEKVWKLVCLCSVVSFFKLCNGLPIHLESTIPADPSVALLSEVIVILLTVCTVLLLVGCLCCHRPSGFKDDREEFHDSPVAVSSVSNVDNGLVNPSAEDAFSIFAPLGRQIFPSSNERLHLGEEYTYGDINVSSWFNEGEYDFPRTQLKYIKELGKGWFGSVVEGTAQDTENRTWTPVVVRILESTASTKEKVFFLHEAEIYRCGNHTNLLKLHGRCLNSEPFLLLQELCPQGDLKGYLLSNKSNNNLLASEYPLVWCCQITSALKFLHEKGLAHSDLACRNCQLTSNLTVKLGDYGLASSKYPEDYYEGIPTISVRWCAPESIRHTSTTIQPERITREANVWSLAVCFWEICECGARPYADLTDDEVVTQVLGKAHIRLPRPSQVVLYTDYIYRLMESCWLTPESRPTSTQIYLTLTDLLQVFTVCKSENNGASADLQGSQESFDMRWNSLKPNNATNSADSVKKLEVKPMSPSMNNLIGSLDDMNRSRTSEEDNAHSVLLSGKSNPKFEFELSSHSKEPLETDSLDDSLVYNMRRSSSSETEEENWKKKIERGAYTEKVRIKSRSVTDLMVLTHIDCSESESETPQPSLDHRVNYKNVRLAPRHLESASQVHGSEGNLLSVQDDFQAELRKLQEEHRDSLFFVPDKYSQKLRNEQVNNNLGIDSDNCLGESTSNERLIKELSSTGEITPVNQVYNVFNVTIDNLSPIHVVKLNEIINLEESLEYNENKTFVSYEVPKLCDIIQNNSIVANILEDDYEAINNSDISDEDEICPQKFGVSEETPNFDLNHSGETEKYDGHKDVENREYVPKEDEDTRNEKDSVIDFPNNISTPSANFKDAYSEEIIDIKKNHLNNEKEILKEENNDRDETFNIKTAESHINKEICEMKKDDKLNNLCVPDGCGESVLSDEIISDIQDKGNEDNGLSKNSIKEVEIREYHLVKCKEFDESSNTEESDKENKHEMINKDFKNQEIKLDLMEKEEIVQVRLECNEDSNSVRNDQLVLDRDEKSCNVSEFCMKEKNQMDTKDFENQEIQQEENIFENGNDMPKNDIGSKVGESPSLICNGSEENLNTRQSDTGNKTQKNLKDFEYQELQPNFIEEKSEEASLPLIMPIGYNESVELVLGQDVNTDEVQKSEKVPSSVNEKIEYEDLKLAESSEASPPNLEDSLDSIEEKKVVEDSELLILLNEKNKNTLEDLYVFQMGENLNSFEMNSQISDFSLPSERYKEIIENIEEESTSESENKPEFLKDETNLNKVFMEKANEKIEGNNTESVDENCQGDSAIEAKSFEVPKLIELIENDDKLMEYIITNYESELHDNLSSENSCKNNTVVIEQSANKNDSADYPVVNFDLSNSQEATNPNSLTHLSTFSSLRTKPKSSLELISSTPSKKSKDVDSEDLEESNNLNYSLETWDNFIGNAIDTRNVNDQTIVFESLNSEPQSMIFIEADGVDLTVTPPNSDIEVSLEGGFLEDVYSNQTINIQEDDDNLNKTYDVDDSELNKTYDVSTLEGSFSMEDCASDEQDESGTWESSGGWFLHPQSSGTLSGQITEQRDVRTMDDEILAALRGELLAKLPHAQGSTSDKLKENDEEWDPSEKDEVFLRYNVYNTPLSPIPEESENEEDSFICTATGSPASEASDDWPEKLLENVAPQENDSQSLKAQGLHHQHTLSQDSCCSNDTLFNLEDMTYVVADQEVKTDQDAVQNGEDKTKKLEEERIKRDAIDYFKMGTAVGMPLESPVLDLESPMEPTTDKAYLADFLIRERVHSEMVSVVVTTCDQSESNSSQSPPIVKAAAPLPSPDDHPWKQLSDSLLRKGLLEAGRKGSDDSETQDSVAYQETPVSSHVDENTVGVAEQEDTPTDNPPVYENVISETELADAQARVQGEEGLPEYINVIGGAERDDDTPTYTNLKSQVELPEYVNVVEERDVVVYENVGGVEDFNEEDYVNITNMENTKISSDFEKEGDLNDSESPEYVQVDADHVIRNEDEEQDDQLFGVLTDIRFSGPGESHLMSTSFSESNDLQNEQDWESGSDTRSSSSGEFIWREGEHEESLKALQALPQDMLDDMDPNKDSKEETSSESSCSDDEGECPEFIPSAWDKYATPTKSALRSPEKTLEKEEKKKGVWFKKQRYHCVYEYPKEPDSPVLQSFDLWNNPPPTTSYPEWYFDIDSNIEYNDYTTTTNFSEGDGLSTDFTTSFNNEFFVTSSATPFDMITGTSSQFFPGGDHWSEMSKLNENTTPDSGVEDVTPGSIDRIDFVSSGSSSVVPSLKLLSEAAYARSKQKGKDHRTNEILGGLRHTRDKLKLDLPSSPNTFTSNKTFNLEPNVEPVVLRERPAFTTFGKSRFLVQHVDTPDMDTTGKNVCFDALPYKPLEKKELELKTKKIKKEEEKGEASLLDSADEDSGIESSTLERKSSDAGKLIVDL